MINSAEAVKSALVHTFLLSTIHTKQHSASKTPEDAEEEG